MSFFFLLSVIRGFLISIISANLHKRRHRKRPPAKVDGLSNLVGVELLNLVKHSHTNSLQVGSKRFLSQII